MPRGGARPGAGNPGFGKVAAVRAYYDKYAPAFWQMMEKMKNSPDPNDNRLFITEFNKIQVKFIPQEVSGINGAPIQHEMVSDVIYQQIVSREANRLTGSRKE